MKSLVQGQLLHCGKQRIGDSWQQGKLYLPEVQALQTVETKATSRQQRKNKQHILPPTLPKQHPMFWAEGQGEGPLCRQGEIWKTPEGLDDTCHLTAKRQQLAHYRRRNPDAWQSPVEDVSQVQHWCQETSQEQQVIKKYLQLSNLSTGCACMHA